MLFIEQHFCWQDIEEGGETRALRDSDLRVSAPHLQRVSSINLQLLERDAKRRKAQPDQPQVNDYSPCFWLDTVDISVAI